MNGEGRVNAGSGEFVVSAAFPRTDGEPPRTTTPEEMLAAGSRRESASRVLDPVVV